MLDLTKQVISAFLCVILFIGGLLSCIKRVAPTIAMPQNSPPYTLILDAGHGGEDGGAVSPSGHKESDINLNIVLKLHSLMTFLGLRTILVRSGDISIYSEGCNTLREKKVSDLKNRVAMVQNTQNAMLLSVHQNIFTDPRYHGAQVFFGKGDISRQWGDYAQDTLRSVLDPDNSRKAAAIPDHVYLFQHIDCPAILVECGFLSNGEDSSLLLTDSYQRKIALVLAGAYFHQLQMIPDFMEGD